MAPHLSVELVIALIKWVVSWLEDDWLALPQTRAQCIKFLADAEGEVLPWSAFVLGQAVRDRVTRKWAGILPSIERGDRLVAWVSLGRCGVL